MKLAYWLKSTISNLLLPLEDFQPFVRMPAIRWNRSGQFLARPGFFDHDLPRGSEIGSASLIYFILRLAFLSVNPVARGGGQSLFKLFNFALSSLIPSFKIPQGRLQPLSVSWASSVFLLFSHWQAVVIIDSPRVIF